MRSTVWLIGVGVMAGCVDVGDTRVLPAQEPSDLPPTQEPDDAPTQEAPDEEEVPGTPAGVARPTDPLEAITFARDDAAAYEAQVADTRARVAALRAVSGCSAGAAAWRGGWHATVQDALDAVHTDAVVLLCPGTHVGTFTAHAGDTVLLAPWVPGTVTLSSASGSVLASDATNLALLDLTVSGATSSAVTSSGVLFAAVGSRFVGNTSDYEGGALHVSASAALIVRSTFTDNRAEYGGGGAVVVAPWLAVVDSTFEDNSSGYEAGAIEAFHATWIPTAGLILTAHNQFIGNHADYEGGALAVGIRWTPLWGASVNDTFLDNTAGYSAGGIQASPAGGRYDVLGSTFTGCGASREGGVIDFGGWSTFDSTLQDVEITDSTSAPVLFGYAGDELLPASVHVSGGRFLRNAGAAVITARRNRVAGLPVRITGDDVDFGTGADANAGLALAFCTDTEGTLDFAYGGGGAEFCR